MRKVKVIHSKMDAPMNARNAKQVHHIAVNGKVTMQALQLPLDILITPYLQQ
jgi:hypothetical protein